MVGIVFNGKHSSNDYGLVLNYFQPQPPAPKKILEGVPFMNGDGYDFSTIGSSGQIVYNMRDIDCKLTIMGSNEIDLFEQYSNVLEWLISGKSQLTHDLMPDIYFLAEVRETPSFTKDKSTAEIQFKFKADPFKYLRDNQMITLTRPQSVFNQYVYCNPFIRVYGSGNFTLNGQIYAVSGTYTDLNYLILKPGENIISFDSNITQIEITPNWRRI